MSNHRDTRPTSPLIVVSDDDCQKYNFSWYDPNESQLSYNPLADMHDLLLREYHTLHNLKLPRNYSDLKVIAEHKSLRAVLPDNDGWWWSSDSRAMVRLQTATLRQFSPEVYACYRDRPIPTQRRREPSDEPSLREVENRIIERAQPYALRNHAVPLFRNAIKQAEDDIKQLCSDENDVLDRGLEALEERNFRYFSESREALEQEEREQQTRSCKSVYAHLRLHWLREAQAYIVRIMNKTTRQKITKISRLIYPEDVMDADDALRRLASAEYTGAEDEIEHDLRLGSWYAGMLYTCGTTESELAEVLGSYSDWGTLVKRIRQNNTDYKRRRYSE